MPKILTLEELQNIEALEQEYKDLQKLELNFVKDNGALDKKISKGVSSTLLYTNADNIDSLLNSLEVIIKDYLKTANKKGKLLSEKAVDKFLDDSEKRDILQKKERLIRQLNKKRARKRLALAIQELRKEGNILKSDISLFIKRQRLLGVDTKDILIDLVRMGKNKQGFAQAFRERVKRLGIDAIKFEKQHAEIDHYKLFVKSSEKWQWITVSSSPCPDCRARAGSILKFREWKKLGLPGSGNTVCNKYCLCKLYPVSVAEDKFPNVKEFKIDKDKLVLTPVGEFNLLNKGKKPNEKV